MAAHGRADIRADCKWVSEPSEALGADVVFVTQLHPKQSPTEHCEAELKLTAGVVVFSGGVNALCE
jgi:AmiR/NasT family two-component response regulator